MNTPLPEFRKTKRRLTSEMKTLTPGQSFLTDFKTARCFSQWVRYATPHLPVMRKVSENQFQVGIVVDPLAALKAEATKP